MSKFLSVNVQDFLKGLFIAVGGTILASLSVILNAQRLPNKAELIMICITALGVGVTYLLKNYFTNSVGQPLKTEEQGKLDNVKKIMTPLLILGFIFLSSIFSSVKADEFRLFNDLLRPSLPPAQKLSTIKFKQGMKLAKQDIENIDADSVVVKVNQAYWAFKTDITQSVFTFSKTDGEKLIQPGFLTFTGFGLSYVRQVYFEDKNVVLMSVALDLIVFPGVADQMLNVDIGACLLVNPFDGIGFGVAFNGGKKIPHQSRWMAVLSFTKSLFIN